MIKLELIRFCIVGVIAVSVQYGVYYLVQLLASHNVAYTIGYLVSFTINYILTTSFTFKASKNFNNGIGFTACHIINFLLQIGLLNFFIYIDMNKVIAPLPVFAICVPTNFLLVKWVMKKF